MSRRFAVVYEAPRDFETATELADRVIIESVSWLDPEHDRDSFRAWVGESPEGIPLTWTNIKGLAKKKGINAFGHFGGEPGEPDAASARRALLYLQKEFEDDHLEAVLLIRDQDDEPKRKIGLDQARDSKAYPFQVVVGLAIIERESWVICGFEPKTDKEGALLQSEISRVGWDPRSRPQDLKAGKNDNADKSPKRVLVALTEGKLDRQRECWSATDLKLLNERGRENGLAEYFREIKERLVPLISGTR